MANYTERVREEVGDLIEKRKTDLHRHAQTYKRLFLNKRVTYYFYSKGVPKRRTIYFYKKNFMHLCGVSNYENGWKGFYKDCLYNTLKPATARALKRRFVEPKIDAMEGLPKLLISGNVGFSDDAVVHMGTNYGELVRTQENLIALGTIKDRTTQNQVPISMINLEVSTDGMIKATDNWCKVSNIRVEDIEERDTDMHLKEREHDKKMKELTDKAVKDNKKRQEEQRRLRREKQSQEDKKRKAVLRQNANKESSTNQGSTPKKEGSKTNNNKRVDPKDESNVKVNRYYSKKNRKSQTGNKQKDRSKGVKV